MDVDKNWGRLKRFEVIREGLASVSDRLTSEQLLILADDLHAVIRLRRGRAAVPGESPVLVFDEDDKPGGPEPLASSPFA